MVTERYDDEVRGPLLLLTSQPSSFILRTIESSKDRDPVFAYLRWFSFGYFGNSASAAS